MSLKRTAFFAIHTWLGAKIVEFGGYEMPVKYTSIIEEHKRVREYVGVFDVSHMGEVEIQGKNALEFLQKITVNDASKLTEGGVQYSAMCYDDGGIVDDLLVYHLGDRYMLVLNASNTAKDIAWIKQHVSGDVTVRDVGDATSLLALQGPRSLDVLRKLTGEDLLSLQYYHCRWGTLAGVQMLISRTGYTGELGFELYFPSDVKTGEKVWNAVMEAGKEFQIAPIGLGARDTLRLEMGYCLYGHDIDATTNPLEAGLGWITKPAKGEFIGCEAIRRLQQGGLKRKLAGFVLGDKGFPRQGYGLRYNGTEIGKVTSGTFSPTLGKGIGMGYIRKDLAVTGTPLRVALRSNEAPATVVPLPFVKKL